MDTFDLVSTLTLTSELSEVPIGCNSGGVGVATFQRSIFQGRV